MSGERRSELRTRLQYLKKNQVDEFSQMFSQQSQRSFVMYLTKALPHCGPEEIFQSADAFGA